MIRQSYGMLVPPGCRLAPQEVASLQERLAVMSQQNKDVIQEHMRWGLPPYTLAIWQRHWWLLYYV